MSKPPKKKRCHIIPGDRIAVDGPAVVYVVSGVSRVIVAAQPEVKIDHIPFKAKKPLDISAEKQNT